VADQLSLLDAIDKAVTAEREFARTHAHRDDPATSRLAARGAVTFSSEHCRKILDALSALPDGGTTHEIAEKVGSLDYVQVARRMKDLARQERVVASDKTRPTPSGKPSIVWKLAQGAKESA